MTAFKATIAEKILRKGSSYLVCFSVNLLDLFYFKKLGLNNCFKNLIFIMPKESSVKRRESFLLYMRKRRLGRMRRTSLNFSIIYVLTSIFLE